MSDHSITEKTGYEASDIIEDALQLAVDEELKDEDIISESSHSSKVNMKTSQNEVKCKNYSEDSAPEQKPSLLSPPRPETAAVMVSLTSDDKISMDASKLKSTTTDDTSLVVHLDDTHSDMDGDPEGANSSDINDSRDTNEKKSIRKSINESNSDSKSESNENKNSTEELNNSSKDSNKLSEKDSSKSKSSNVQKDNKLKNRDSKNASASQKAQTANGRNIWVSGLPQDTKASELQNLFSKHGKVVSAKIIKNARMTGSRCYGFITMENSEQVSKCITHLNKTELHSKTITLSRNRPQESTSKSTVARKVNSTKRVVTKTSNKSNASKDGDNKETKSDDKNEDKSRSKSSDDKSGNKTTSESGSNKGNDSKDDKRKPIRAPLRDRVVTSFRRPNVPFRRPQPPFHRPFMGASIRGFHRGGFTRGGGMTRGTSFFRGGYSRGMGYSRGTGFMRGGIRPVMGLNRPDVDRQIRERERERRIRDERRHREELMRVEKDMEREERIRFEREKERLKVERMRLEREKAEFFRVERERAKLEREKIEREREELRRRQQNQSIIGNRVEDTRSRPSVVSTLAKRPFETREDTNSFYEERKRQQQMQRFDNHFVPGRPTYQESSPSVANRHSIANSYNNRNDSYKRNTRFEPPMTGNNSRAVFDMRRDSRHGMSHDRDERKAGTAPTYYNRDSSRSTSFNPRDRKIGGPQREDWKSSQFDRSRPSDRYSDKPMTRGSTSGFGTSGRNSYGTDSRNWNDRSANSLNKLSYGSGGGVHMSGGQQWGQSSGNRWNSALSSSNDSRSRGQTGLNSGMMSSSNSSISHLYSQNPMPALSLGSISHSMSNSGNMSSGDRYIHSNRRF